MVVVGSGQRGGDAAHQRPVPAGELPGVAARSRIAGPVQAREGLGGGPTDVWRSRVEPVEHVGGCSFEGVGTVEVGSQHRPGQIGVVGPLAGAPFERPTTDDLAVDPELATDIGGGHELDGRAESVSGRNTEQASTHPVPHIDDVSPPSISGPP